MTNAFVPPPPSFATPRAALAYYFHWLNFTEDGLGVDMMQTAYLDLFWPAVHDLVDLKMKASGFVHKPSPEQRRVSYLARPELRWLDFKHRMPGRYLEEAKDAVSLGVPVAPWVALDAQMLGDG